MQTFNVKNVSEALWVVKQAIKEEGRLVQTRNGDALEFTGPVITKYRNSRQRVIFYPERDANPFFHLMESLWMLAGRNDVEWISQFNHRIEEYSDDGDVFHGAYGFRWREWFGDDQLVTALERLSLYENDRRTVVGMWDPWEDLRTDNGGKDYPCNTQIFFWKRDEKLHMTVVNRSNDMIWGAYGANAVHMSFLLEYMAGKLKLKVGDYYQFSNNLHAYTDVLYKLDDMQPDYDPYLSLSDQGLSYTSPYLINNPDTFDTELKKWFAQDTLYQHYENKYLETTCDPVRRAWSFWKNKCPLKAIDECYTIEDRAWRRACVEWLERRLK